MTADQLPTASSSKPVPPGTPPPSPPPGGPRHPEPTAPPPRDSAGGPRPDTTRLVPLPRPPAGPGRMTGPKIPGPDPLPPPSPPTPARLSNAALLDEIDAQLVGLLAIAHFGPAEQGTAVSVDQACAAEALLGAFRAGRNAVRLMRHAYGIQLPARRLAVSPVAGLGSNSVVAEKLRRSARVAVDGAAAATVSPPAGSEGGRAGEQAVLAQSPGAVRDSRLVSDGPSAPGTAAHGGPATPPPGADFSLPRTPRFSMREGERRLYGGVEPGEGQLYDSLPGQHVGVAEYRGAR